MSRAAIVLLLLAAASTARGELLSERWAGKDTPATHAGTLAVTDGKTPRLVFDLSALPKGAKVHRASLLCFTRGDRQPKQPAVLRMAQEVDAEGGKRGQSPFVRSTLRAVPANGDCPLFPAGRPFELEGPWFRSFDVTQAVAAWSKDPARNLGFIVVSFDQLLPAKSCLDVLYEGPSPGKTPPPQIRGVRAVHHDGQTFILWQEHPAFVPARQDVVWVDELCLTGDKLAGGPGKTARGLERTAAVTLKTLRGLQGLKGRWQPSGFQGIKPLEREKEVPAVRYRIYRHTERITAANLPQAERIAEVEPLSSYDDGMAQIVYQGEFINQRELPDSVVATYCYADNRQLPPGECLYVHTCRAGGRFYYAVTDALAGTENAWQMGGENSLAEAVEEAVAPPRPVLQFIQENAHHKGVPEYWFRYWAGPPYYHLPSRMFRIAASVPPKYQAPGPLELESIHDPWNVREKILVPPEAAIRLLAEPIHGYMPDLCYNEGEGTLRAAAQSKVDYFAERFMANLIQWAIQRWDVDRTKISGGMMHFGLRHPEIFSVMSFGTYTATYDYRWAPGSQSLPGLLGPKGIKTVTGEDAWSEFSAGWYVNRHPDRDIPFLVCQSNVGKDVGHTSEFGWQDDPRGWGELNKARATYVASWSTDFSREFHEGLRRVDWSKTLPAFSRGSLDNNPGNGDPADGDYYGTINGWLLWGSDSVDEPGRWEMTVYVIPFCIRNDCTVDITPRHCKLFKAKPGEKFRYTNVSLADGKTVQADELTADQWGLLTIPQARVSKGKNRIRVVRAPPQATPLE